MIRPRISYDSIADVGQTDNWEIPIAYDDNMSGGESSDSSDADAHEDEPEGAFAPPASKAATPPPSSTSSSTATSAPATTTTTTKSPSSSSSQPPIISPLVYQTPQGMMYATPSNGGVIFSLAQTDSAHPQFITIPLSMVAANGQGELDLSKRK
ncbi:hypothetical protein TcasGA2_TC004914 [Tribolium castaneum]|uniref:Uncharacterized protein n=1 Tax=Tribolium castaneum TaxID=7070 RepID=D6WCK4_TRICA|nr:hypothetical protein TcasGA2_TC004914 [Tribolium castaneum]